MLTRAQNSLGKRTSQDAKARLLVVSPSFPPRAGGIERLAGAVADGLLGLGWDVEVVAGKSDRNSGMRPPDGLKIAWARNEPFGGRRADMALGRLTVAVGLRFRPGVILVMHLRAMPAVRLLARLTGARVVLAVHAKEMREQPALARASMRWANRIAAASQYSLQLALEAGADTAKTSIIHPGVHFSDHGSPELAARLSPPTIVTVSRLNDAYKGHDVALEALAFVLRTHPNVRWKMVGDGDLRPSLQARADELGLSPYVEFTGSLSDDELGAVLDDAYIFCLLSRPAPAGAAGEGFGIALIEAGLHRLPVVAGRTPGVTDAVLDGETGLLIDASKPREVSDALTRLLEDADLAERLGSGGRSRAASLDWPHVVGRYASVIRKVSQPPHAQKASSVDWARDVIFGPRREAHYETTDSSA